MGLQYKQQYKQMGSPPPNKAETSGVCVRGIRVQYYGRLSSKWLTITGSQYTSAWTASEKQ